MTVEPFVPPPKWDRSGIAAEVQALARFLGCDQVELTFRAEG
ncbi:hypothetical protein BH23ACT12_BH23ACT12_21270 [soil metagenome]